jgi:hypothetical protein
VVSLRGDELAPLDADVRALRQVADYHSRRQRTSVEHPVPGCIDFTGIEGRSCGMRREPGVWRLVPALLNIVAAAAITGIGIHASGG